MTVYLLAASFNSYSQDTFDNSNLDAFNVTVKFDEIGSYVFPALYEDPNGLYLPVDALFNLLKIVNTPSSDGQVVKGYVETPDNAFEINLPERFVTFKGEKTKIDKGEATMDMGSVYLRSSVYERAFGFKISFNFRALLATFTSGFELPVIKLKKQEQAREKLNSKGESVAYDTILKRDYHWFKGGMFDWSVASSQAKGYTNETRVELGGGSEILGGETNIFLNASNVYGMKREQQQYSWRWANNDASLVRQIQLGRVNSRSIASLLSPVDGFVVSNTPTTVRKALGNYVISNYTSPDWYVELYVNNILTGYTKADASGFYSFAMPIVFGTSNITLRFYGPGGEMRSEEKTFNMPYNMMPKGEFEYRITGGELMDSLNSRYGRAEFSYGLFRTFTAGAGMEYLSSISTGPEIPFVNFTFQPFSSMLITGEYAYNVRAKGTMNLTLPLHSTLELNYAKYTPGQKAIIYNYLEERSGSLSIPYRFRLLSGYTKAVFRQNIYSNFSYNSGEAMISANYRNCSMSYSNFLNWTATGSSNIYGNLALGFKLGKDLTVRPSAQYNYTAKSLISLRAELETRLFKDAQLALRYENNVMSRFNNVNLSFRYDLPYVSTYLAAGWGNKQFQLSESARGGFAFGSGNKYVIADKRGFVGRCGVSIASYVDTNFNGVRDEGEPSTEQIKVRCSGGQVIDRDKDSIIRIVGLEPFVDYTIIFDESGFQSLAWRLPFKTVKITADPNQFKQILVAVQPMGEISGMIVDKAGNGIGRVIVNFINEKGEKVGRVLSESDGYFTMIGFRPGNYQVGIDTTQLRILKMTSQPVNVTVKPNIQGDVVDCGSIIMAKLPGTDTLSVTKTEMPKVERPAFDNLLSFVILFDHDKTLIRAEYIGTLENLADMLKGDTSLILQIQGHTDNVGGLKYNQMLSERRAAAVKRYLIVSGVSSKQLQAVGFGETRPVNNNATEAEKMLNRRVTFDHGIHDQSGTQSEAKPCPLQLERKPDENVDKVTGLPPEQQLRISSLTKPEMVVTRKATKDMVFLEFSDKTFVIQFGAFKTFNKAGRLCQVVKRVIPDQVEVRYEAGLYKVQTFHIEGTEETVRVAKKVRMADILQFN